MIAKKIISIIIALVFSSASSASEKTVHCLIESNGNSPYKGNCLFLREKGGSFTLRSIDKLKPILEQISNISIYIIEKDVAEVRGLTLDGINSRWGNAKRSSKDTACWVGGDFKICVW